MLRFIAVAALAFALNAVSATAQADETLVVKNSVYNATTTMDRLQKIVESKGLNVFARIDHAAGAKAVGQQLAPTELLIFGSAKLGTPLMQSARSFGLDLPLKVLVWEGKDGLARLTYNRPADLAARHQALKPGTGTAKIIAKITKALDAMTTAAGQP